MAYEKVGWKDYPSKDTPIAEDLLNKMDDGIYENDKNIQSLISGQQAAGEATKIGKSTIGSATSPVYINNGVPKECTPASAVKQSDNGIVSGGAVHTAVNNMKTVIITYTDSKDAALDKKYNEAVTNLLYQVRDTKNEIISWASGTFASGADITYANQRIDSLAQSVTANANAIHSLQSQINQLADRVARLESRVH